MFKSIIMFEAESVEAGEHILFDNNKSYIIGNFDGKWLNDVLGGGSALGWRKGDSRLDVALHPLHFSLLPV